MIEEALAFLDRHVNLEATAGKVEGLSLQRMRDLVQLLGDPQLSYPVIQVTGTNGKGSTSSMISAVLTSMGLTVGQYGSPHVSSITERIQRSGEPIGEDEFAELILTLEPAAAAMPEPPSWFELMTAAAYLWFADVAVDVAVVEVGKLGRFDATNIVDAHVAVVTNIGYDHTDGADDWRRNIAWEKAGIISPSSILCLGPVGDDLDDLFVAEQPREIWRRHQEFDVVDNVLAVGGRLLELTTPNGRHPDLFVSLYGAHQGDNAAMALAASEAFLGTAISEDVVTEAFAELSFPGRFEVLGQSPLVVVDGAHNPDGAEVAVDTLDDTFLVAGRRILITGMMNERDPERMLEALAAARFELVIATRPPSPRGMDAQKLADAARGMGIDVEVVAEPAEALRRAQALAGEEDLIFAAGSLYIAGAVRDSYNPEL